MNSPTILESKLQDLFVNYKPIDVMNTWNKIMHDFKTVAQAYDTKPFPTIVLKNEIVEPITKPVEPKTTSNPAPDKEKEAQKEKMRIHREVITKKRQELAAQGVIPETQLTEENLRKWIQVERKNYWTIAEETGCNDNDISHIAKTKNILSETAMMIRKKRAKL